MRLSLSRPEVDILLETIELKRKSLKNPTIKTVNALLMLKHKLLEFRNQVWDTEFKAV